MIVGILVILFLLTASLIGRRLAEKQAVLITTLNPLGVKAGNVVVVDGCRFVITSIRASTFTIEELDASS